MKSVAFARHERDIKAVLAMGYFIVRGNPRGDSLPFTLIRRLWNEGGAHHERSMITDDTYWERYRLNEFGRAILRKLVG